MHKPLKIAAFSGLFLLFYLLIGMGNSTPLSHTDRFEKREMPEKEDHFSSDSQLSLSFAQRTQVNLSVTPGTNLSKTFWESLWLAPRTIERAFKVSNAQQVGYAKNILYRLKLTDLLFPFHYFW